MIHDDALRLKRSNGKITAHYSFDSGTTWTQFGSEYELPPEYQTSPLKVGYRVKREWNSAYRFNTLPVIVSGGEVDLAAVTEAQSYFDDTNADVDSVSCAADGCTMSGATNVAAMLSTEVFSNDVTFTIELIDRQNFGTGYQAGLWLFFAPDTATVNDITTVGDEVFKTYAVATVGDKIHATIDHTWMYMRSQTDSGTLDQTGGDNYKNMNGYLKLERADGIIKAWMSSNGNSWQQIGTDQALPSNLATIPVKIGLRIQKNWAPGYDMKVLTTVEN
jgi:hypothetical protein